MYKKNDKTKSIILQQKIKRDLFFYNNLNIKYENNLFYNLYLNQKQINNSRKSSIFQLRLKIELVFRDKINFKLFNLFSQNFQSIALNKQVLRNFFKYQEFSFLIQKIHSNQKMLRLIKLIKSKRGITIETGHVRKSIVHFKFDIIFYQVNTHLSFVRKSQQMIKTNKGWLLLSTNTNTSKHFNIQCNLYYKINYLQQVQKSSITIGTKWQLIHPFKQRLQIFNQFFKYLKKSKNQLKTINFQLCNKLVICCKKNKMYNQSTIIQIFLLIISRSSDIYVFKIQNNQIYKQIYIIMTLEILQAIYNQLNIYQLIIQNKFQIQIKVHQNLKIERNKQNQY
ncbi:hypothetical protein TTHERM_000071029 (macronuclear) [Tetrahymena thermophila SB210]|uniref:Uncharacterized protein n=1 Tax=Tetrahymena thermophila (strain SB210) TaxID=312017 RepID=W7XAQ7_TETTS|nr:hypothetical protein TTHERM_000071029 [Tetrahymena thermophila SB210]EWS76445.1 hypothetical protein TTHERM_000071029 [Tetrahymena thermophila SB210]|eukprot:XP_012651022.1 hypothetical protein TTHERM_000071029 [Tetrahymena thermophila SB210]